MITVEFTMNAWLELLHVAQAPVVTAWRALVRDEIVPSIGSIAVADLSPLDVERMLVELEQAGASVQRRMLCHYALIEALEVGRMLGWVRGNAAVRAQPC